MKLVEGLVVLIIGGVLGAGLTYFLRMEQPCPDIQTDTVFQKIEIDTNKLYSDWLLSIKPKTIYITKKDTVELPPELPTGDWYKSSIDTTVEKNNAKAILSVESYAKCPVELSLLELAIESICIDSIKTIKEIEVHTVEVPEPFYKDEWFYSTIVLGAIVVKFVIEALGK